jgi:hypothetical protein
VNDRLKVGASDADLETLPAQGADAHGAPGSVGRDLGVTHRPSDAPGASGGQGEGPPAGVPANGGRNPHHPGPPPGPPGRP